MPTFETPEPITASVEVVSGAVHVTATDREDTVVQISPRDPNRASDIRIAEAARVDFRERHPHRVGGQTVHLPWPRRRRHRRHRTSVAVTAAGVVGVRDSPCRRRAR